MKKGLIWEIVILVLTTSNIVFAAPTLFFQGVTDPSGLGVHPNEHKLYVISGASGSVWTIAINNNGTAGAWNLVTDSFPPNVDIDFDASGNLFGLSDELYRLQSSGIVDNTDLSYDKGTAIAIEKPGLSSHKLFFTYSGNDNIPWIYLSDYNPGGSLSRRGYLSSCGSFRFFHYREGLNDIVATLEGRVVSVNPTSGICSEMINGLVQPNGIAEDSAGNVYIADTGSGEIVMRTLLGTVKTIASELDSPMGLAYDAATNSLFISELGANRILRIDLSNSSNICEDGIVFGKNPVTGEWAAFLSVCEVPYGWTVSNIAPDWFLDETGLKQPRVPVVIPLGD